VVEEHGGSGFSGIPTPLVWCEQFLGTYWLVIDMVVRYQATCSDPELSRIDPGHLIRRWPDLTPLSICFDSDCRVRPSTVHHVRTGNLTTESRRSLVDIRTVCSQLDQPLGYTPIVGPLGLGNDNSQHQSLSKHNLKSNATDTQSQIQKLQSTLFHFPKLKPTQRKPNQQRHWLLNHKTPISTQTLTETN
jgi:hypothetical protein